MAQLALGIAGAAIGFAIGGPTGAQIGFAAGSFLGSSLGPGTTTQGPRLSDLKVQVSSYGQAIPRGYGGFPVAGNVIWSTDLQEERNSEEVGKGGPSQTNVSYSYSVSCAIALCEGPIAGVRRIWADSKLVYDARDDADADTIEASSEFAEFFTLYLGTEDQLPDPTMEADKGAGNVPAYLGTAYIVFTDLPLADFGNRIPNFLFEVFTEGAPDAVQGDGLLCHFDEMDGSDVLSAVGPNVTPVGDAVLDGGAAKFGDNGGTTSDGAASFTATGVTGNLTEKNWRAEVFFKPSQDFNYGIINLERIGASPAYSIEVSRGIFLSALVAEYTTDASSGGGGVGSNTYAPIVGEWNHFAMQYQTSDETLYGFLNGVRLGGIVGGSDLFPASGDTFTRVTLPNADLTEFDEVYYQLEPDEMYGETYVVPTGPFDANDNGETFTPGQVFLPDVVEALCLECGLEAGEIDVTDLPNEEVLGYTRARQMPGRAALDPLRQAYYFDAVESDGKVKFVPRGGSSVVTIDDDELGAIEGENDPQPATEPIRAQEAELPAVVNVAYLDRDVDYENGAQTSRRVVTGSVQQQSIELPLVLTHQHAADAASVLLYDAWTARTEVSWSTTKKYAKYEPTDVVTLVDGAITRQVRITDKSEEGPVIKWKGRDDKPSVYDPNATPSEPTGTGATIRITGETVVELIDSPIFLDSNDDPGFYLAARGTKSGWNGGALYWSTDAGSSYSSLKTVSKTATMGSTLTELGDWTGGYVVDELNTVDVELDSGSLASVTRDQLLNGGQAAIIGNEVVCFQRAELIAPNQYRLSGFIRGARGTEDQIGEHAVGDRFVLVSAANWYRVEALLATVGHEYLYKPVTFGKSLESVTAEAFTNTGRGLKPFSPVDLRAGTDDTGTVFTWKRRTRLGTRLTGPAGIACPLGEASEAYVLEIYSGSDYGTVVRTINATSQTATYTATQQALDFGSVQTSFYVKVYQVSESVGRGFPLVAAINAAEGTDGGETLDARRLSLTFEAGDVSDDTGIHTPVAYGDAVASTDEAYQGTYALSVSGDGCLTVPQVSRSLMPGNSNFSYRGAYKLNSITGNQFIFAYGNTPSDVGVASTLKMNVNDSYPSQVFASGTFGGEADGTMGYTVSLGGEPAVSGDGWYAFELRRTGDVFALYVNDVLIDSQAIPQPGLHLGLWSLRDEPLNIGGFYNVNASEPQRAIDGYVDSFVVDFE